MLELVIGCMFIFHKAVFSFLLGGLPVELAFLVYDLYKIKREDFKKVPVDLIRFLGIVQWLSLIFSGSFQRIKHPWSHSAIMLFYLLILINALERVPVTLNLF